MKTAIGVLFRLVSLSGFLLLSACAGSVAPPTTVQALASQDMKAPQLSDISGEVKQGVAMTPSEIERIIEEVKAEMVAKYPDSLKAPSAEQSQMKMTILFTQYDEGSAMARALLIGLGQIHIEGEVSLLDAKTGAVRGKYEVSKDFALGGLAGAMTTVEEVEKGFARSVVAIFQPPKS